LTLSGVMADLRRDLKKVEPQTLPFGRPRGGEQALRGGKALAKHLTTKGGKGEETQVIGNKVQALLHLCTK